MENPRPPGAPFGAPRRVFTAPVSATTSQPASASRSADGLVETLYAHPSAKIVAFTAGSRPVPLHRGRSIASPTEVEPGTLSWSSQLERTIAVGPFRIYRAPGSVAFLNCGSALQPILPKSQCWCVDEESSKYVLQIRRPQYWRIEIPVVDAEDVRRAQLLREVLGKILQFEKTECPFKRSFTVELPERPQTPVKKRPWTPVRRPVVSLPPTPVTPIEVRALLNKPEETPAPAKMEEKEAQSQLVEAAPESKLEETLPAAAEDTSDSEHTEAPLETEQTSTSAATAEEEPMPRTTKEENPSVEILTNSYEELASNIPVAARPNGFQASRSITAPPQLSLLTSLSAKSGSKERPILPLEVSVAQSRTPSRTPSHESFHSVKSWHSPIASLPPSPPLSDPDSPLNFLYPHSKIARASTTPVHTPGASDLAAALETPQTWRANSTADVTPLATAVPTAPPSVADTGVEDIEEDSPSSAVTADEQPLATSPLEETETAPAETHTSSSASSSTAMTRRPRIRHRATTSSSISPSRRALSPLPPAVNLFTPRQPVGLAARNKLAVVRRLPMAVIQKTCEILLSPPSHLMNLMLKVAARIAAGEWRGFVFGTGDSGERIPVHWDWSDADDDGDGELDGWHADDDWPHQGMGRKMAGSFPDDDTSSSVSDGETATSNIPNGMLSDADWSRSWEVD